MCIFEVIFKTYRRYCMSRILSWWNNYKFTSFSIQTNLLLICLLRIMFGQFSVSKPGHKNDKKRGGGGGGGSIHRNTWNIINTIINIINTWNNMEYVVSNHIRMFFGDYCCMYDDIRIDDTSEVFIGMANTFSLLAGQIAMGYSVLFS